MIRETYFSALSNRDIVPGDSAKVFAVVSDLPEWTEELVDRNIPALAPPEDLLEARSRIEDAAKQNDEDDPEAVAWRSVDFEERYRAHVTSGGRHQVLESLAETVEQRTVWLVSWRARASLDHRSIALEELQRRADLGPCPPRDHEWGRGVVPTVVVCQRCGYGSTSLSTGQLAQENLKPYLGGDGQ
ncbi:hypothetical protein GL213_14360 [Halogeometricum borinquense]|nr:hypothetical protein GL213_14360 [Halogeometricum borinquense]